MPGFNGTGPRGEGSESGRGMGLCRNQNNLATDSEDVQVGKGRCGFGRRGRMRNAVEANEFGRGRGRGRRQGRGFGRMGRNQSDNIE